MKSTKLKNKMWKILSVKRGEMNKKKETKISQTCVRIGVM